MIWETLNKKADNNTLACMITIFVNTENKKSKCLSHAVYLNGVLLIVNNPGLNGFKKSIFFKGSNLCKHLAVIPKYYVFLRFNSPNIILLANDLT